MNFKHPIDTKHFIIGLLASMAGIIVWDIVKYKKRLFEYKTDSNK